MQSYVQNSTYVPREVFLAFLYKQNLLIKYAFSDDRGREAGLLRRRHEVRIISVC